MNEQVTKKNFYAWIILFCAVLMNLIFLGLAWNTNQLYFSFILNDNPDFTRTAMMLTVTLAGLANTGFSLVFGKISKKLGVKMVILLGVICAVVSMFLYSISSNLPMFYIAAFLVGTSIAFATTTTTAVLINTWFAKRTGTILSIATTFSGFGGLIFPKLVTGWCVNLGWNISFRYSGIVCLVAGVVLLLLVRIKPENMGLRPLWAENVEDTAATAGGIPAEPPGLTMSQAKKTKNLWFLFIMYFFMGWIIYAVQQSTALYTATLGYSPEQVAGVVQALFLGNMIAQIPLGMLADKFGVRKVLPTGLVVFTIGLVLLIVPNAGLMRLSIVGFIVGASVVLMAGFLPIVIREVFGLKDYAGILGNGIAARTIGIAIGPPLHNLVYDLLGSYQAAFVAYVAVMLGCIVLALFGTKKIALTQTQEQAYGSNPAKT